jgi:outer membrane protein TolC
MNNTSKTAPPIRRLASLVPWLLLLNPASAFSETLEEAWQTALAVDHRLEASRQVTESSRQGLSAAEAARFPNLTVEAGYTRLSDTPAAVVNLPILPIRELPLQEDRSRAYKTVATVPLYTSGRITGGINTAGAAVNAAQADEHRTELDVKLAVAEAYVAALRAARIRDVAHTNVSSLSSFSGDVANLYDQGMVARNDLLAAQVALADAQQRAIQADNGLDLAHSAYNRLLGRELMQPVDLIERVPAARSPDLNTATTDALAQRPELKTLAEQAQALRHQADSVRGSGGPQVFVSGGYSFQENKYQAHEGIWAVTLGVKWDVFDGGLIRGQAASIARRADSVESLRQDAISGVTLQVRQAWLEVGEARKRIEVAQIAIGQAEENLKVAKDRYSAGMGTNTEVLDAETARVRALTNFHNAVYDAVLADIRLKRAVGVL